MEESAQAVFEIFNFGWATWSCGGAAFGFALQFAHQGFGLADVEIEAQDAIQRGVQWNGCWASPEARGRDLR